MFLLGSYTLELSCAGILSFSSSVVCASRSTAQRQVVKYLRNPCASQDLFRLHEARTSTEGILLTDNTLSSLTDVASGVQSSALHAVQHVPIPQAPPLTVLPSLVLADGQRFCSSLQNLQCR